MTRSRVLLAAAIVAALVLILATPAGAQCEGGDCRLTPPQSRQVNSEASSGSGSTADLGYPGLAQPVAIGDLPNVSVSDITVDPALVSAGDLIVDRPPSTVDLSGPPSPVPRPPLFAALDIRLRFQDPSDVSCGVQALGMALDGLDGAAPTSSAILGFLQDSGLMYDFGTGVEELAYAAQTFGYEGSFAFHGASLDQLQAELDAGRPVVAALGANGQGVPGHFVTVTGFSPDGDWVAYNDPILGEKVVPTEEFLRFWDLQGNAGVSVLKDLPPAAPDYRPWVAFLAGLMALISTAPLATRRKGIGGAILAGAGNLGPPYAAPAGYRWEQQQKPVYVWKDVEVVDQVEVPNMVTRQVQVGAKTIYEELPVYKTVTIDEGHWQNRTVTRYRQETYVKGYTTRAKRIREPDGRWLSMPIRIPVYGTRSVPYTERERRWIPRPVQKQILVNVKQIPVQVPMYEERLVQDGTRIEEVTRTERKRIQVGTEAEWVLKPISADDPLVRNGGGKPQALPASQTDYGDPDPWMVWASNYENTVRSQGEDEDLTFAEKWLAEAAQALASPVTWYEALREDEAIEFMKHVGGLPSIPITLPMLKGFGQDELFGKIYQTVIDPNASTRILGRTLGDVGYGPLFLFGLGLTVYPNLKENIAEGALWNQTAADVIVDGGGFVVSEGAGAAAGALMAGYSTNPLAVYGSKVFVDFGTGVAWEVWAREQGWSDTVSIWLKAEAEEAGRSVARWMDEQAAQQREWLDHEEGLRVATPSPSNQALEAQSTPQPEATPTP